MPKPTQIIRHHMTWQNHQVCVGYCSSKTFVWGKLCFSPVTAIYNQQLEVWGICKAITTGSDPCPCLQFSKQGGEEYIVQQMSQNYQPRTTPPPYHQPPTTQTASVQNFYIPPPVKLERRIEDAGFTV